MLKETPRSLRAYFVLVALLCVLASVGMLGQAKGNPVLWLFATLTLGFAVLDGYIAYRVEHLLRHQPGFIKGVLTAGVLYGSLVSVLGLFAGQAGASLIRLAVMIPVYFYLTNQVTKLAADASPEPPVLATPSLKV